MASKGEDYTGRSDKKYLLDRAHDVQSKEEESYYPELPLLQDSIQEPLGDEEEEHPYLGWVRVFSEHQMQVGLASRGKGNPSKFLNYHVPLDMRGKYKIDDPIGLLGERRGPGGWAVCTAKNQVRNIRGEQVREQPTPCRAKALNRSGLCSRHGGMLHPLDRQRVDWDKAPRELRWKFGKLAVEDLDDEELARGQIRREDGTFTSSRMVPVEVHDRMVKELFDRADVRLRENLLTAVDTAAEIAQGTAYDEGVRLQAAKWMYETVRGKVPTKVELDVSPKFEQVMDAVIIGGSRAESRAARGLQDEVLDAEVEDLDLPDLPMLEAQVVDNQGSYEDYDDEEAYDYRDDCDRSIARDLEPEPVIHHGAAGKPTTDYHPSPEGYDQHNRRVEENRRAAEEKQVQFAKKRKAPGLTPEQLAENAKARKEHADAKRKHIAKRKAFLNQGDNTIPEPIQHVITDEPGGVRTITLNTEEMR
ncbi:hypothetical protein SEA_LITTLEFELLA_90 [Gordonia phage LittleFella]|nr:hypothetical protein SEA_LITTLEFELLA_90 [Gordonia phage LittleFella]